jgi:hypothetical protein
MQIAEYWLGVLIRTLSSMPEFVGNNWVGFVLGLCLALKPQADDLRRRAFSGLTIKQRWYIVKDVMMDHWKQNLKFVSYVVGVFVLGHMLQLVANDYKTQETSVTILRQENAKLKTGVDGQIANATEPLKAQVASLTTQCAVREGINRTLERQNRDQNLLIAGCQSEALKLLTPVATKITPVVFDQEQKGVITRTVRWIVLSNKLLTPIHFNTVCDQGVAEIYSVNTRVLGGGNAILNGGSGRLAPTAWETRRDGTWSPENPLFVTIEYRGLQDIACSFTPR